MNIEINHENFNKVIYGFGGIAVNKNYAATAFKLMDNMWKVVKQNALPNKGLNIWVYEAGHAVFAGVELEAPPANETGLEIKTIQLAKYASYKHVGPYNKLGETSAKANSELAKKGYKTSLPYIEIYGHWTPDETKLETDILVCVEEL